MPTLHDEVGKPRPNLDLILELIKVCGPDPVDEYGFTPLYYASTLASCQLLVEHGANIRAANPHGLTALHRAMDPKIVQFLVDYGMPNIGADVNALTRNGRSPMVPNLLEDSQISQWIEKCRILLDRGADARLLNGNYHVYKYLSNRIGLEFASLLIEHGLDINFRDAIHYARDTSTLQFLLDNGADINTVTRDGSTLLHESVSNPSLFKMLLENGADLEIANNQRTTVYDILSSRNPDNFNRIECLKLLVEHVGAGNNMGGRLHLLKRTNISGGKLADKCFLMEHGIGCDEEMANVVREDNFEYVLDHTLPGEYICLARSVKMVNFMEEQGHSVMDYLFHYVNFNRMDIVEYLLPNAPNEWLAENLHHLRVPSKRMLNVIQLPICPWHFSSHDLKRELARGIGDDELLEKDDVVSRMVLEKRQECLEWFKLWLSYWRQDSSCNRLADNDECVSRFLKLPRMLVPRIILFII